MLTQSILNNLNNNNPLLAIYNSSSSSSSNNNTTSNNNVTNTSNIKDTNTTALTQMRHSMNDSTATTTTNTTNNNTTSIKQENDDLLQHIHERIREQAVQEMQRRYHEQIEDLINAGLIHNNILQTTQLNHHQTSPSSNLSNNNNVNHKPPISPNQIASKATAKSPINIQNDRKSKSPEEANLDDSIFPRYNSIDNISKKLNAMAKINSNEHNNSDTPQSIAKLALKDRLTSHLNSANTNSKENYAKQLLHSRLIDNSTSSSTITIPSAQSSYSLLNGSQPMISLNGNSNETNLSLQQSSQSSSPSNSNVYVPPCTSNGISTELRQKLRDNILRKQDKNFNSSSLHTNSTNGHHHHPHHHHNQTIQNSINNNNGDNQYLNGSSSSLLDDSGLRRTNSEPTLKVKSALQNRLKQRNHLNPLFNNKRPYLPQQQQQHQQQQQYSNNQIANGKTKLVNNYQIEELQASLLANSASLKLAKDVNNNEQNAMAAMVAAAIMQQQQQQQQQQQHTSQQYSQLQRLGLSAPFLNAVVSQSQPYLNSLHWQALAAASALENYNAMVQHHPIKESHNSSLSLSALPNPMHSNGRASSSSNGGVGVGSGGGGATFIPKFGNIAHIEEESELLLANELRNANKIDNSFMYDQKDDEMNSFNSNSKTHLTAPMNSHLLKKLACYSEPYLLKSHESDSRITSNNRVLMNNSDTNATKINNNDTAMDYEEDEHKYKYTTGIVYDSRMLKHECTCHNSKNHIETPDRLKAIYSRLEARNLLDECEVIKANKIASLEDIAICHNEFYTTIYGTNLEERAKLRPEYLQYYITNICLAECNGFALVSDQDNSWNEENTPIACRVAIAATYELADLVVKGKLRNGFALVRPPGSHAEYNKPLGFCYFNNIAIVAKMLKKNLKLDRILIVDWDVHHGNGTQQLTYDDPNILFISLHRHDKGKFFPGSGANDECGSEDGLGFNVNIAWDGKLEPPMGDADYLAAFRCVVMPIAKSFQPQLVLVSSGFDGTDGHPKELGGYKLTPMCFAYMTKKLMSLAEGKVILVLEGGYDLPSLCDSSEACLNALMNKQIPAFPNETLDEIPNNPAIETLEKVIDIQKNFWPCLKDNQKYIKMSQNQFIQIDTAE